jgi:cytochrome P450/NADPH-cytochrome P450 reductase
MRACIGRAFAWQEALLVMAILLQNFDFRADDPSYDLRIKSNLTIKPEGFYMRATLRKGVDASRLQERLSSQTGMYDKPFPIILCVQFTLHAYRCMSIFADLSFSF